MNNARTMRLCLAAAGCLATLSMLGTDAVATLPVTNGLVFWVKADTGVQTNANGVYLWQDQSGCGNDATQSLAGYEPAVVPNVTGPRNNKPVVRFASGATNSLLFTLPNASNFGGMTFVIVASHGPSQDPREIVVGSGESASPGIRWALGMGYNGSEGLGWGGTGGGNTLGSGANLTNTSAYVQSYVKTKNTGWTVNSGKGEFTTGTVTTVSDTSFPSGDFHGVLGLEKDGVASSGLSGDIAEVLIYSTALTSADLDQTRTYLAEKYVNSTPEDYLVLCLKADAGVQTNAGGVYLWQDQSGMGNDATQSVINYAPALVQNVAGVQNDKPVVRFDGSAMGFLLSNACAYSGMSFVFVASHGPSHATAETVVGSGQASSGIRWGLGMGSSATEGLGWGKNSSQGLGSGASLSNSTFYLQSYVKSKGTGSGWIINSGESAGSTGTVTSVADDFFPGADFIGSLGSEQAGVPAYGLSGDIVELRIYRMALSDAWFDQVRSELKAKYLSGVFPAVGPVITVD